MLKVIGSVIKKSNHNFDFVDLGGGMGIKYNKETKKLDYKKYNSIIKNFLSKYRTKIIFEPGRSIIGDTALLLTRVLYIKKTRKINFVILDAAMNDLMRPALYGSRHEIMASIKSKKMIRKKHEFVGPICEATDKFLSVPKFQTLREKDILAICDVGAYGMVLSSNYNLRTRSATRWRNSALCRHCCQIHCGLLRIYSSPAGYGPVRSSLIFRNVCSASHT